MLYTFYIANDSINTWRDIGKWNTKFMRGIFNFSARRRTLLDTSGNSSIFQNNHGSQSSEDASHSREPSMEKSHKHNGEQSDDSEDDDLISLNQFLNESNRSPKSRVKIPSIYERPHRSVFVRCS